MAAMTTVLTKFAENGDSRTSTTAAHTALIPRIVIEKRRVPTGKQTTLETSVKVVHATTNAEGVTLVEKVMFEAVSRYPLLGQTADVNAALVIFRDIVASDEFANQVSTQEFLKA